MDADVHTSAIAPSHGALLQDPDDKKSTPRHTRDDAQQHNVPYNPFNDPGLDACAESLVGPDLALIVDEIGPSACVVEACLSWARRGYAHAQHMGMLVPENRH